MLRVKHLALGLLATASVCPSAFALNQAAVDAVVGTDHEFFIGGATALDSPLKSFLINDLCTAGTVDTYQDIDANNTKAGNWFAVTCTLKSVAPVPVSLQGSNAIIHKRTKIGSVYGSFPIARNSYQEFLNLKSTRGSGQCVADAAANTFNCTVAASGSPNRDLPRAANTDECDYNSAAPANPVAPASATLDTLCRRAMLGVADVESEMFQGINLPNKTGDNMVKLTAGDIASITRTRAVGQLFGVAVSNSVFTALQTAQGIATGAPLADGSNWPSLSRDTIRQLFSGSAATWSAALRSVSLAGTLNNLTVCRREQGSGTQATSNQYFFNYPCDANAAQPRQDTGGQLVSGLDVVENNSSGLAKTCLNSVEAGANGFPQSGAIGILSYNGNPGGAETWKWIKLDGVQPSMQNAVLGKYDFWYEAQIGFNAVNQNSVESDLAGAFISELIQPTRISTANSNGIAALSVNGFVWDSGNNTAFPSNFTATNPVMGGKHGALATGYPAAGTSTLSCRTIQNAADGAGTPNR